MEKNEETFLKKYNPNKYERPSVSVDILIFALRDSVRMEVKRKSLSILLIKRKNHPYRNHWAIPGGFVNMDESLEDAAYRELREETNVKDISLEQLYTFGDVQRDPRMRVISIAYLAFSTDATIQAIAGDDAKEVKWFFLEKEGDTLSLISEDNCVKMQYSIQNDILIPQSETAFAFDHQRIFYMGLKRIIEKIERKDDVYNMLCRYLSDKEIDEIKMIR